MTDSIKKTLLIKHFTGRVLLDTSKRECSFELNPVSGGWEFRVYDVPPEIVDRIHRELRDLNFFYFEQEDSGMLHKWWLYDKAVPHLRYEAAPGTMIITVDTRVSYSNDKV